MLRGGRFSAGGAFSLAETTLLGGIARSRLVEVGGKQVGAITKRRRRPFYRERLFAAIARWRWIRYEPYVHVTPAKHSSSASKISSPPGNPSAHSSKQSLPGLQPWSSMQM